ncbi:hypothetical protein UPYG_G00226020 [Umbra pygmaea]|uniref:Uncharacterized protein n=1 Tax=Umbra pygmaea TaxID=75934 RepID=A0ABD0WUR6_UMBPY
MVFISLTLKSVLKYFNRNGRAVSLDEDRKWSVHYTTQKPQQETGCVDDLCTVLRGCDSKLRRDGYGSSQYFSQNPAYLSPSLSEGRLHVDKYRKSQSRKQSTASSPDEDCLAFSFRPPPNPPPNCYENIDDTVNSCDDPANGCNVAVAEDTEWTKSLPLPTPEEKMRQQAQAIGAEVVPINITGESFERQACFRRALANTDTLSRRPRNKLTRRKTITGIPNDITTVLENPAADDPGSEGSVVLPGLYSTVGRTGSVNTAVLQRSVTPRSQPQTQPQTQPHSPSDTTEAAQKGVDEGEEGRAEKESVDQEQRVVKPSARRIRAQRGQGISSLMASLTTSLSTNPSFVPQSQPSLTLTCSPSLASVTLVGEDGGEDFHSLPRQDTMTSLSSESCLSTPYRKLSDTESFSESLSGEGWSNRPQNQCTFLAEDWSYDPLLPYSHSSPLHPLSSPSQTDCSSLCSEDTDTGRHSPLQWLKSHSHGCISADYTTGSNRCHHSSTSLAHSFSLRKSKRPPTPPIRSTSLQRKPGQGKLPHYNCNSASSQNGDVDAEVERSLQTSSPALVSPPMSPVVFEDPWVPRCNSLSSLGQGGRGGVETDRQVPHFHSFHYPPSPDQDPASPCLEQPLQLSSVPRSASAGGVSLPTGPSLAAFSPKMAASTGRHQRLGSSNSSGYSSQCNTPTPSSPQFSSSLPPPEPLFLNLLLSPRTTAV